MESAQNNFRTKNVLFGYFRLKVEKVLSYFQHPRICQNAKFLAKLKILNFGSKNVWFRCLKNYCHIWNQQPLICHLGVFDQYSGFCHRVRFFLRSTFFSRCIYLMVNTRGVFRIQSNIYDEAFFSKIVNSFQPLTIFSKKLQRTCSTEL